MKTTLPIEWLDRWGKPTWLFDACVVHVSSSIHVTSVLYISIHYIICCSVSVYSQQPYLATCMHVYITRQVFSDVS